MRNKYSLKSQLLGKRTYSNAVNRMYESLIRSRNAGQDRPDWFQALEKFINDKFGGQEQFDYQSPKEMSSAESDIIQDYKKAIRIYDELKKIQGPIDKTKEEEIKKEIAEYVKLSKAVRRNLKKIFKKGSLERKMEPDHAKKYFKNTGTMDIEPIQDFSFRVTPQTDRTMDFVDGEGNRYPIGQDSDQQAKRPSQAPQSARVQDNISNTIVKTSAGDESLGDFLKRLVQMSGVSDDQAAKRFGDAKKYPKSMPYDAQTSPVLNFKYSSSKSGKLKSYRFTINPTQTVGQKLGLPLVKSDQLSRISGILEVKTDVTKEVKGKNVYIYKPVREPSTELSEFVVAAVLNASVTAASPNPNVDVATDAFVQGDTKSFDVEGGEIIAGDGNTKWEVKQLKKGSTAKPAKDLIQTPEGRVDPDNHGRYDRTTSSPAATGVGMRPKTSNNLDTMKDLLNFIFITNDLVSGLVPGHSELVNILQTSKGGVKKKGREAKQWKTSPGYDPLWINPSASEDAEGRTLMNTLKSFEGSGAFGSNSKTSELIGKLLANINKAMNMDEEELGYVRSNAGTTAAGAGFGDKSNYSFKELWIDLNDKNIRKNNRKLVTFKTAAKLNDQQIDAITQNVNKINSGADLSLVSNDIMGQLASAYSLTYLKDTPTGNAPEFVKRNRPGSNPFISMMFTGGVDSVTEVSGLKDAWIEAAIADLLFFPSNTENQRIAIAENLAAKLQIMMVSLRGEYPSFFRDKVKAAFSKTPASQVANQQKSDNEIITATYEFIARLFDINVTDPSGRNIQSFKLFEDIAAAYLDKVDGFAFVYTDTSGVSNVYILPSKAAVFYASKGYLRFSGPSLGNYKINFVPPETGNKKFYTEVPLDKVPSKVQPLITITESYSVFNGGSPGRTLNEWVKWATK